MPAPRFAIVLDASDETGFPLNRLPRDFVERADLVVTSTGKVLKQRFGSSTNVRKARRAARLLGVKGTKP
ncbi:MULTISPECIES: hypothetical protein [unclassified Bradyrhizobium]|uniref:hypothetical protein n=1 Tax=unclassified Bradyrhizobium TaxID=2631580 RepID=UPI0028EE09CD|nr:MULTISPECIES: hypothetical protein [unclassified Bradyrhizobium]